MYSWLTTTESGTRPSAVLSMSDADFSQNMTAIQLSGRRLILVVAALEEGLTALR